jgi:Immunoglobulin-like domain of bacterial spore germination/Sporulation and spore germination
VLAVTLVAAACGDDDGSASTTTAPTTTTALPTSTTATPATNPAEQTEVRSYFLRDEVVGPVARTAEAPAVARGAMEGLLAGPTDEEAGIGFSTAIPAGSELLGLDVADDVATVDLSSEFGSGGGSLSIMGRVAQVVFTLTQFPTVGAVVFEIEGEPVTALGGEGLVLDGPQTRADWEELSPAILVESPLPFADVTSPLEISGTANTFEATVLVNVTDGDGLIVYDDHTTATSGSGTRGTFDLTATFDVPQPGVGEVIVFEESAQDGSRVNIVEVPVRIS